MAMKNGNKTKGIGMDQKVNRMVKSPLFSTTKTKDQGYADDDEKTEDEKPVQSKETEKPKVTKKKKQSNILDDLSSTSESEELASENVIDNLPKHENPVVNTVSIVDSVNEMARQELLASESSESDEDVSEEMDTKEVLEDKLAAEKPPIGLVEQAEKETADDVHSDPVTDESTNLKKETNVKSSKLLRMSLGDPDAIPDSSKTTPKEKLEKKSIKKKRGANRIDSDTDFETSDSDFEKRKKRSRKRPSASTEEEDSEQETDSKPKSKRRRRIKKATSSEDEESKDSDIEILNESQRSEANGSKGRKNIKKIIKDQNLKVIVE